MSLAASFLVGVALGSGHFALFTWTIRRALAGERPTASLGFLTVALALRHLLLAIAFIGSWRQFGLQPLAMGGGVTAAYVVLRLVLMRRLR